MVVTLSKITVLLFYIFMVISIANDAKSSENTENRYTNPENDATGHDMLSRGESVAAGHDTPSRGHENQDSSKDLRIFTFDTDLNHNEHTSSFRENYVDLAVSNAGSSVSSFTYCFRFEVLSLNEQCLFYEGTPDIEFNFPEPHLNYGLVHFRGKANIFQLPHGLELLPRVWYHVCVSHEDKGHGQMSIKAYFDGFNVINELVEIDAKPITFEATWRIGFCKNYLTHKHLSPLSTILRGALSDFNVWAKALTDSEMIMFTKTCTRPGVGKLPAPDVINWETAVAIKGNNAIEEMLPWVCSQHETSTLIFDQDTLYDTAMLWCQQLGGFMPLPKTPSELESLSILLSTAIEGSKSEGCEHFWMPILQRQETTTATIESHGTDHRRKRSASLMGQPRVSSYDTSESFMWTEYSNKDVSVSFMPWDAGQPDGLQFQPCVSLDLTTKKYHDNPCHHAAFCGFCQFKSPVHYVLRGSPELLELDTEYVYVPHGKMVGTSSIILAGYVDQFIELNANLTTWEIASKSNGRIKIAKLKDFGHRDLLSGHVVHQSPFGRKTWIYEQNGKQMETELKLTMCNPKSHFTCNDGSCIEMEKRCDNVPNCKDSSDEYDCGVILLDTHTYRRQYPPILDMKHHVYVDVSAEILKMGNFEDLTMSYKVKFVLILKWHDHHLIYSNLKENFHENLVSDEKKHAIWIPPLTFNNTNGNVRVSADEASAHVYIEREGKPTVAPISVIDETFYYSGHENKVVFTAEYELDFHCPFYLRCYPFDTQVCGMEVKLDPAVMEHASIRDEMVKYLGEKLLSQYEVMDVRIVSKSPDYLEVEFTLKRMYAYYLATTYLPSICLLLAAEITLFIDESHFEATTMVALTSMLVMYTLYSSTTQVLPKTSYLKMIDIWLLPGLILPFVVFVLEVLVELLNWKLERMDKVAEEKRKLSGGDNDVEKRQKIFDIMLKHNDTTPGADFDRRNSATPSSPSIPTLKTREDKNYAIDHTRNRIVVAKFILRNVVGLFVIPIFTVFVFIAYIIAVLAGCLFV